MVRALFFEDQRIKMIKDAEESRNNLLVLSAAIAVVAFYNILGVLDIISTFAAIGLGLAEEANPIMRAAMENMGWGWMAAKLLMQLTVSVMVLWFPHRLVVVLFTLAVMLNTFVVLNNFRIVFGV